VDNTLVYNHAAAQAEIDTVHVPLAFGAFKIAYFMGLAVTVFVDVVDMFVIDIKNIGNRALHNQLYFAFIEKQAKARLAAFYS
jgi:hypothetical protein